MKNKKSFLLCGLALLSLVFAISCSNPASPEPQAEKVTITYAKGANVTSEAPAKKSVDKGYKLTEADLPAIKVASNYTADGWYNGSTKAKVGDVVNENITLTSKATKNAVNPDKPEPKPEIPAEESEIVKLVKGKKFIDDSNSIYAYAEDGKSYTMTLNSDKSKVFNYTYTVDVATKTITNESAAGYGNINKFTYKYAIVDGNVKLTEGNVLTGSDKGFPKTMTLKPYTEPKEKIAEVSTPAELKTALADSTVDVIKLQNNIEIKSKDDTVDITRKVAIDLNNKTITASADNTTNFFPIEVLNNSDEVTIKNGNLTHKAGLIITVSNANLSLEKITLTSEAPQACIQIYDNSTVNLNASEITGVVCLLGTKNIINVNSETMMKATEKDGAIQCLKAGNNIYLNEGSTINTQNGTKEQNAIYLVDRADLKENKGTVNGKIHPELK